MNLISREFFISKNTIEKQVAYGEAIGSKREISVEKDIGVIEVKRKEVMPQIGVAKSRDDVSHAKMRQKEKQSEIEI